MTMFDQHESETLKHAFMQPDFRKYRKTEIQNVRSFLYLNKEFGAFYLFNELL